MFEVDGLTVLSRPNHSVIPYFCWKYNIKLYLHFTYRNLEVYLEFHIPKSLGEGGCLL